MFWYARQRLLLGASVRHASSSRSCGNRTPNGFLQLRYAPRVRAALRAACFVWLVTGVTSLLPLVLPVLPIDAFLRYQSHLPFEVPKTERSFVGASMPQYYADEFLWMVEAVARAYHSLPPSEQAKAAIFVKTTTRRRQSTSSVRSTVCQRRSVAIKTIFSGDPGTTRVKL